MEKNKNLKELTIEIGTNGKEAFATLEEWVKTVPKMIHEIKMNGTKEELKAYQMQVKMVLDKLQAIEKEIKND